MDGIHDLGGMHGFGPVRVERDEPVFHAALGGPGLRAHRRHRRLVRAQHRQVPPRIERMDAGRVPERGLLRALAARARDAAGRSRRACGRRGRSAGPRAGAYDSETRDSPPSNLRPASQRPRTPAATGQQPHGTAATRPPALALPPRGRSSAALRRRRHRARAQPPSRRPHAPARYVRGKRGRVETIYAAYVYPDTHAHDLGEEPQYLYCVAFEGEELWGPGPSRAPACTSISSSPISKPVLVSRT